MVDEVSKPVVVSSSAGLIDSMQAAGRYLTVIVGFVVFLMGSVRTKDMAGAAAYIQANLGQFLSAVAGLIALGTAAYGVFRTWLRGAQIATVAASPKVPNNVAKLK